MSRSRENHPDGIELMRPKSAERGVHGLTFLERDGKRGRDVARRVACHGLIVSNVWRGLSFKMARVMTRTIKLGEQSARTNSTAAYSSPSRQAVQQTTG